MPVCCIPAYVHIFLNILNVGKRKCSIFRKRKLTVVDIGKTMEKCIALQKTLEKLYPRNDVTVILTLDNNKLHIEEDQKNKDESPNPQRQIIFKCGYVHEDKLVNMRLSKEDEDILDKWYSQNRPPAALNKHQVAELIELTTTKECSIRKYVRLRQEQFEKCTFTSEDLIELLHHQNKEHSGEILLEESDATDAKKSKEEPQEEELQVRLGHSWHLKK